MYCLKADERHRPIFLICSSDIPAMAADVAAPILKLWDEQLLLDKPKSLMHSFNLYEKCWEVRGSPPKCLKK